MSAVNKTSIDSIINLLPENLQTLENEKGLSYVEIRDLHVDQSDKIRGTNEKISEFIGVVALVASIAATCIALFGQQYGMIVVIGLTGGGLFLSLGGAIGLGIGCYKLLKYLTPQATLEKLPGFSPVSIKSLDEWSDRAIDNRTLSDIFYQTTEFCQRELLQKADFFQIQTFRKEMPFKRFNQLLEQVDSVSLKLLKFIYRVGKLTKPEEIKTVLQTDKIKQVVRTNPMFAEYFDGHLKHAWAPDLYQSMKEFIGGGEQCIKLPELQLATKRDLWDEFCEGKLKERLDASKGPVTLDPEDYRSFERFVDRVNGIRVDSTKDSLVQDLVFLQKYGQVKIFKLMEIELRELYNQFPDSKLVLLASQYRQFELLQILTKKRIEKHFLGGTISMKDTFAAAQKLNSPTLRQHCLDRAICYITKGPWNYTHPRSHDHISTYELFCEAYEVLDKASFAKYVETISSHDQYYNYQQNVRMLKDFILARIQEGKEDMKPLLGYFKAHD